MFVHYLRRREADNVRKSDVLNWYLEEMVTTGEPSQEELLEKKMIVEKVSCFISVVCGLQKEKSEMQFYCILWVKSSAYIYSPWRILSITGAWPTGISGQRFGPYLQNRSEGQGSWWQYGRRHGTPRRPSAHSAPQLVRRIVLSYWTVIIFTSNTPLSQTILPTNGRLHSFLSLRYYGIKMYINKHVETILFFVILEVINYINILFNVFVLPSII